MSKEKDTKIKTNVIYWIIFLLIQTCIVGVIEYRFNKNITNFEAYLDDKGQIKISQRKVYSNMAQSLRALIRDDIDKELKKEERQKLIKDYSTLWLWAGDETILQLNKLLDHNTISRTTLTKNHELYANTMLSMRNEIIKDTKLKIDDFLFLR